jgi:hypothetical protein
MYRVYNWRGEVQDDAYGVKRVYLRGRNYPGLKISRTIGDLISHQVGIISEPSFMVHNINKMTDKTFLMGSSGLWEYF